MRKALSRLTATGLLVTTLALAGCGIGSPSPTPSAADPGKTTNLTMMVWRTIGSEAAQVMAESYMKKHPNVHITLKQASFEQMQDEDGTANTAMTDGVDIALVPAEVAVGLNRAGALKDLSSLRLPALDPALAGLMEEVGTTNGKRYGLPISFMPELILISQQALRQVGIKEPPLDWSVQDFEQVAISLKNAGVRLDITLEDVADPIIHAYGGQLYDTTIQAWALDTPEVRQGLAAVARLVQAQIIRAAMQTSEGGAGGPAGLTATFADGMISGGTGTWLYLPTPKGPKGRGNPVTAVLAVVNANSVQGDVAADFVREILVNPTSQSGLAAAGIRPVTADSRAMATWRETVGDRTARVTDLALQSAYTIPEQLKGNTARTIGEALMPYLLGKAALDQILPDLMKSLR